MKEGVLMAAETTPGPTVPRRQLGRHLRAAQPGEADDQAGCPGAGVVRAQAVADRDRPDRAASLDVAAMCRVYGASAEVTEGLVWLAQETKGRGWWHAQDDVIPDWLNLYLGLEEAASRLLRYESELIPNLLQTAGYRGGSPRRAGLARADPPGRRGAFT